MKNLLLIFLLFAIKVSAQTPFPLFVPTNPDSIKTVVNVNGSPRTVYNIDLVRYRAALIARDTAAALRLLIAGNTSAIATNTSSISANTTAIAGAFGTVTTLPDSTGFTLNRPNGTKDTIQIAIPAPIDTTGIKLRPIAGTNMTITGTYPNLTFNSTASGGSSGGLDTSAIHKTGDETIRSGVKTFASSVSGVASSPTMLSSIKITSPIASAQSSDTSAGIYINPALTGTATNQFGLYSVSDISVKAMRIGLGKAGDQGNTVLGYQALNTHSSGTGSFMTAIGNQALKSAANTATYNTAVGASSQQTITSGAQNTSVGMNSLYAATASVSSNSAVGMYSLGQTTGSNGTAVGLNAGRTSSGGGVYLGNSAGQNDATSSKLYIANSATSALVYGDFSTGQVVVNSRTTPNVGTVISAAQFQVNTTPTQTNRGSIPAPRMPQAQRDLIAVQQGVLTDVIMTSNGSGCSSGTTVTITGGGTGAAATATFGTGVQYISITAGGTGYTPGSTTVTFSGGGCATAPTGVAIIGAEGLSVYCTDCTATDGTRGVLQYYNGSATSPWKNAW